MKVGIEMYIVFAFDGYKAFRCFVPYDTDRTPNLLTTTGLQVGSLATTIVNLSANVVLKHRGAGELILSDEFVHIIKTISLTDFEEVKRYATQPVQQDVIGEFRGAYGFLSNFHPAEFVWEGILWKNSEAAYQGAKTGIRDTLHEFSKMDSPAKAKRAGKTVAMRPDWGKVKVRIMRDIVFAKFNQNPDLKEQLLATGNSQLEEGNEWKDTFWGVCPPYSDFGNNHLGQILMQLRAEFRVFDC